VLQEITGEELSDCMVRLTLMAATRRVTP